MKTWIAFPLALLLAFGLGGCGQAEPAGAETPAAQSQPVTKRETAHIHSYESVVTERTCTQDGSAEYRCACGDVYVGAVKPAPGHSYVDEVFEATIAADGFTRHTCTVCGNTYEDNIVPMLPDGIEDGSFFDDAVFVGDSIINAMKTYAQLNNCYGEGLFLCRPSYALRHAVEDTMLLSYRGGSYTFPEALAASGAGKLFIQLGMNDIATVGPKAAMGYWEELLPEIRAVCPDILIFIQSGTPVYDERGILTNENIEEFNGLLQTFAEENGCFYIDIATPMKSENGFLRYEYCYDQFCHLTMAGCGVWEQTLKDYLLEHKGEFA